jgi:hypothetical protein
MNYIPDSVIKEEKKPDENNYQCIICLSAFQVGETASSLPCLHLFHKDCLEKWIVRKRSCPVCNYDLSLESIISNLV